MQSISLKKVLLTNTFFFAFFVLLFYLFPNLDIHFSKLFFYEEKFISEKHIFIKNLRSFLKDFMIVISVFSLLLIVAGILLKKKVFFFKRRTKLILLGFIVGPVIGCGLIANFYFKDNWGRARPINIQEFGGDKIYAKPFTISDQCKKNCSWIGGEASAAFSFITGTIILKNPIYLIINLIFGIVVSLCRIAMGGHFLSDNIFAMIFMIYLAILYKYFVFLYLKKNV